MSQRPFSSSSFRSRFPKSSLLRDFVDDDDDMFDSNSPVWDFPTSRLGSTVFDTFPRRSTMRSFPSHFDGDTPSSFTSTSSSRWHPPSWVEDELRRSRGTSPMDSSANRRSPTPPTHSAASPGGASSSSFFRQDVPPTRMSHESSRSRDGTPSSNRGGDCSSPPRRHNTDSPESPPVEKHPGVSSKIFNKAPQTARRQPKVHHIPIHVEPRDNHDSSGATPPPNVNMNNGPFADPSVQHHQQQQQQQHQYCTSSSTGRVSRSNSSQSDVASNGSNGSPHGSPRQRRKVKVVPIVQDPIQKEPIPQPAPPTTTTSNESSKASPSSPKPTARKHPLSATEIIENVISSLDGLKPKLEEFSGTRSDKQYLYLDEMLTRNLIKLDNIMTEGNEELRQLRRGAIKIVNSFVQLLESRVIVPSGENMDDEMEVEGENDEKMQGQDEEKMTSTRSEEERVQQQDESCTVAQMCNEQRGDEEQRETSVVVVVNAPPPQCTSSSGMDETTTTIVQGSEGRNDSDDREAKFKSSVNINIATNEGNEVEVPAAEVTTREDNEATS